jgi:hypothetical protein
MADEQEALVGADDFDKAWPINSHGEKSVVSGFWLDSGFFVCEKLSRCYVFRQLIF